jgi:hypothetical protein
MNTYAVTEALEKALEGAKKAAKAAHEAAVLSKVAKTEAHSLLQRSMGQGNEAIRREARKLFDAVIERLGGE